MYAASALAQTLILKYIVFLFPNSLPNCFANDPDCVPEINELSPGAPNIVVDDLMNGDRPVLHIPCPISGLATFG